MIKVLVMAANKCRVCGGDFFKGKLLTLRNMPKAAQHMPDKKDLRSERGIDLVIKQCSSCALIQLNNKPVQYYRDVIRATFASVPMKNFRKKQFKDFVKKSGLNNKKIIEIGCGRGDYLSIMAKAGVKAYGLENNAESVSYCRKNELNAQKGFVTGPSYKIKGSPFDGFYIMSFLEHLPDPRGVMAGISNNLKNEAYGIVEVPNFDMMLKKKLFTEFIIDHLFYFTADTLRTFLSNNGFEVIKCIPVWHDYILSAVVKKRAFFSLKDTNVHLAKLKREVLGFIRKQEEHGGTTAIWGAGHQALTIMSICELTDKVKYVVDSAKFKQGRYTPATHIPIVAPDMLIKKPVSAVVVMAGSYSDEIVDVIRKNFRKITSVSVLRESGLKIIIREQ